MPRTFSGIVFACLLLAALPAGAGLRCFDLFTLPSASDPLVFQNSEVEQLFKNEISLENLGRAAPLFAEKGVFDIPVQEKGFVAAANVGDHAGNYGRFLWLRDFARIQAGLSALPQLLKMVPGMSSRKNVQAHEAKARQVALAQMAVLANKQWTEMAIANISDPHLHTDPVVGHRAVIWTRRLLEPFEQGREPTREERENESTWGHKQNDALAMFALSFLDSLKSGRVRAAEVSEEAKINVILLAAYFLRINYWRMWDVGAWEEGYGQRTSSIALVTSFLERFQEGFNQPGPPKVRHEEDRFFADLRDNAMTILEHRLPLPTAAIIEDALLPNAVQKAIGEAYALIRERLPVNASSHLIESQSPWETRFEDTALLHSFWHPLRKVGTWQRDNVVNKLAAFERPAGYIRYAADWFLYGSAMAALHNLPLPGPLAVRDGSAGEWRAATPVDLQKITEAHNTKNMDRVIEISGPYLEAQWTLPDAYLTQMFADAYMRSGDKRDLAKAKHHFRRVSALITGDKTINSEGHSIQAWRLPEAYSPVRVLVNGQAQTRYYASPNSPLNWATAEFILAYERLWKASLKEREKKD